MNDSHGLAAENLLRTLPDVLRNDASMLALAASISGVLVQHIDEVQQLMIYTQIDGLQEDLLDILANDFKVDWWDSDYTVEEKRKTLKESWRVHRMLGTKAAVETAISAVYPDTKVNEWWEYSGKPYHFKLLINATYENVDPEKHRRVLEKVDYYKNLRSVLDEVEYYDSGAAVTEYTAAALAGYELIDSGVAEHY